LAVAVVIVVSLYFGREVFVPMALAILLSFALGPLVLLLRRWRLGRVPAVIVAVLLAFSMIGGVGTLSAPNSSIWQENCPAIKQISRKKSTPSATRRARVELSTVRPQW
jgi:predicted PurR-regulated permease PerM